MQRQKRILAAAVLGVLPFAALGQTSAGAQGDEIFSVQFDKLEYMRAQEDEWAAYDGEAWGGGGENQLVFKAEGEAARGGLRESKTQVLWGHSAATFWDSLLGVRFDHGKDIAKRQWLVLGVQGLAPDWFDVDLAAYVASSGRAAFELDMGYEIPLARRVYLRPSVEMDFHSRNDERWGIGSGLSEATAGVRLRYQLTRELAPYLGVEWQGKFGKTADYARQDGERTHETRLVAGVSFRF